MPTDSQTPVLVANSPFPGEQVKKEFIARSTLLSSEIRDLILLHLNNYNRAIG